MKAEEKLERVKELQWIHILDLGDGIRTPGLWEPSPLDSIGCPVNLQGMTVLDICAADGGYSFAAERRGAARVLATDSWLWGDCPGSSKAAFDFSRDVLSSRVESRYIDVLDHSPNSVGTFDLVFFLGVLYHMRHPLLALERVYSVTKNQLIMETHLDLMDYDRPAIAFYPASELNNDSSNWCGPNIMAVEAMLRTVGFRRVVLFHFKPYPTRVDNLPVFKGNDDKLDLTGIKQGRAIFHAWR
jgi:tRNA (mo5U34)-methyltransferase